MVEISVLCPVLCSCSSVLTLSSPSATGIRVVPARTNLGRLPAAGRHPQVRVSGLSKPLHSALHSFPAMS
jgi:hypothetical protein